MNGDAQGASRNVKSSRANIGKLKYNRWEHALLCSYPGVFVVQRKTPNPRDWQLLTPVEIRVHALDFADTLARYLAIQVPVLRA